MKIIPLGGYKHVLKSWVSPSIMLWVVTMLKVIVFVSLAKINVYLAMAVLFLISFISVALSSLVFIPKKED